MTIPPESIEVGKCYLTRDRRVRRVTEIRPDGKIRYKYRSFPPHPRKIWRSGALPTDIFEAGVEREVPCDWKPEGGDEREEGECDGK